MSKPVVLAAAAAAAAYYLYKNKKEDEPEEVVRVSHAEALEKTTAALKAVGWDDEGARVQASIMVSSETESERQKNETESESADYCIGSYRVPL